MHINGSISTPVLSSDFDKQSPRYKKAVALLDAGAVRPFFVELINGNDNPDYFYVMQSNEEQAYCVLPHSGCDCEDARWLNYRFDGQGSPYLAAQKRIAESNVRCKHEIAVMLYKKSQESVLDTIRNLSDDICMSIDIDDYPDGDFPY